MTTVIADTNVFLRFLTKDIQEQAEKVIIRFNQAKIGKIEIFLLHITLVEILFQLEQWYHLPKKEACDKLILLLFQPWIEIEEKPAVLLALTCYPAFNIDFVDLLTWSAAKTRDAKILSFDRDFDRLSPKLRLRP